MARMKTEKKRLIREDAFWEIEQLDNMLFLRSGSNSTVESEDTVRFFDQEAATLAFKAKYSTKIDEGFRQAEKSNRWQQGEVNSVNVDSLVRNSSAVAEIDGRIADHLELTVRPPGARGQFADRAAHLAKTALLSGFATVDEINDALISDANAVTAFGAAWIQESQLPKELSAGISIRSLAMRRAALFSQVELKRFLVEVGLGRRLEKTTQSLRKLVSESDLVEDDPSAIDIAIDVGPLPDEYARFLESETPIANIGGAAFFIDYFELLTSYKGMLSWFDDSEAMLEVDGRGGPLQANQLLPIGTPWRKSSNYFVLHTGAPSHGRIYLWFHDERSLLIPMADSWTEFRPRLEQADRSGDWPRNLAKVADS